MILAPGAAERARALSSKRPNLAAVRNGRENHPTVIPGMDEIVLGMDETILIGWFHPSPSSVLLQKPGLTV